KYLDDGSVPFDVNGTQIEWTAIDFDDSSWKEAKGGFGAINGEIGDHNGMTPATLLNPYYPEGSDDEGINIPNFFFRTTFDVDFPDVVNLITAEVWYDDAIKIYINGVPVKALHTEMSGSNFGYCGNNCESAFYYSSLRIDDEEFIKSLNLKAKGNVLAVELFQANIGSEDIFFDFGSLFVGKTARNFPFEDVSTDSWYYDSVAKAYNNGMFTGTTETLFSPKMTMSRAMTWTVLARIAGADITTDGKWYAGAQAWAMENGVSDGTNPHNDVTREQLALMLYGLSGKPETVGTLDDFTDKDAASSWAEDGLIWAVANGILSGKGYGILDPKATASRAEACTMLIKYLSVK
nr:S-layer homology domain-containing protein [Clostridia bacterium]